MTKFTEYFKIQETSEKKSKAFIKRLYEVMKLIDSFYRNGNSESSKALRQSHFDLTEIEDDLSNLENKNIRIDKDVIYVTWSGYNHYWMQIPKEFIDMSDDEILRKLEDIHIVDFRCKVQLT